MDPSVVTIIVVVVVVFAILFVLFARYTISYTKREQQRIARRDQAMTDYFENETRKSRDQM
jgi:hypothetical protein